MNLFLFLVFLVSVFSVFYSYVLFPLLLKVLANGKGVVNLPDDKETSVSILIAAFNEENVIRQKIETVLSCDYPSDKIEILIGSDCSSDKTNDIVNELILKDNRVRLFEFDKRRGKPSVVNDLVKAAKFPLIILTDANVYFEKNTITKLVRHFSDEKIGLVGANILNIGIKKDGISMQEKSYIQRENLIKYYEGIVFGTMMGPFGGCYILRKNLFENVPADSLVDDFYISMKILENGFKCVNDLEAICYEDIPNEVSVEFKRKARISAGNFQNLSRFKKFLMNPFHAAGFCFISHKFIRWITPLFLLSSLVSLFFLIPRSNYFLFLFIAELVLLATPIFDWLLKRVGVNNKLIRFVAYFSMMNLALVKGYFIFQKGIKSGMWTPTKRGVE